MRLIKNACCNFSNRCSQRNYPQRTDIQRGKGCEALKTTERKRWVKHQSSSRMSQNLLQNTSLLEIIQDLKYQQNRNVQYQCSICAARDLHTFPLFSISDLDTNKIQYRSDICISLKGTSCHNLFPISFYSTCKANVDYDNLDSVS